MDKNPEFSHTPKVGSSTSPQPSLEGLSDHGSDKSEVDYDALLRQIPGFEAYDYESTPSTRREHTFPKKHGIWSQQTHHRTAEEESPTMNGTQSQPKYHFKNAKPSFSDSAGKRTSSGPQDRFSVHVLAGVVPQLYDISRKRKRLLQLEFRIESVHRKLARTRESLLKELENADNVLKHESDSVADLRRKWRRHSKRLRRYGQELTKEEAALEPLQLKLTQAQYEVITLEDDLHASLTGGAKPGDSDASFEDQLFETAGQQSNLNTDIAVETVAGDQLYNEVPDNDLQASAIPTMSVTASDNQVEANLDTGLLQTRQVSPDKGRPEPRKPNVSRSENIGSESQVLNESTRDRSTKFLDITLCGSLFQETIPTSISQAALAYQLLADASLVSIRKYDLEGALGYPLQDLDVHMNLITKSKKPMNSGVAYALTEANLPRVHTRQMISLWGTAMSQNSAFETLRTLLYGGRAFEQLTGQDRSFLASMRLNPVVVLQLVQDVRQLKVPLDATMRAHDAFLKVDRDIIAAKDNESLFVELGSSKAPTQEQWQEILH